MKACLRKLGLEVSEESTPVPSLSRLHLSSAQPSAVSQLVQNWHEAGIVTKGEDGEECIEGENDVFHLEPVGRWNVVGTVGNAVAAAAKAVVDVLPLPEGGEGCREALSFL